VAQTARHHCSSLSAPVSTAVVPPLLVAAGPLVGLVAGTLAGIYPSLRASRLEPVEALRY